MTFLELVKRTRQECGIPGTGPTTVVNQTGELKRLVDWVAQSWVEIQEEQPDWDFMRKSFSFTTTHGTTQSSGDTVYAGNVYEIVTVSTTNFDSIGDLYSGTANTPGAIYGITTTTVLGSGDSTTLFAKYRYTVGNGATYDINLADFASWRNDSLRSYLVSSGIGTEVILSQYYNYSDFRDFYLLGSRKLVSGRPLYFTIEPYTRAILLGFSPDNTYKVNGEYYTTPQTLSLDADEPTMPSRYHMAIVYKAMQKYGMYEVATEQIQAGQGGYSALLNRMRQEYLPQMEVTGGWL